MRPIILDKGRFTVESLEDSTSWIYEKAHGKEKALVIFSHGAGAPMTHDFMNKISNLLSKAGISVFRFNFLYSDKGKKAPDRMPKLLPVWKAAIDYATANYKPKKLYAMGKSMGGRAASHISCDKELSKYIKGFIYLGFPLHAPGKTDTKKADHFSEMTKRHHFIQGTRDSLCKIELLKPLLKNLDHKLSVIEDGDHSFKVLKRSELSQDETFDKMISEILAFIK